MILFSIAHDIIFVTSTLQPLTELSVAPVIDFMSPNIILPFHILIFVLTVFQWDGNKTLQLNTGFCNLT